jgi:hypothetical protein
MQSREEEDARDDNPRGRRPKKGILADIEQNLLEYGTQRHSLAHVHPANLSPGQILKQAQELTSMNKPHERDHRSLVNFIENHQPLVGGERDFVYCLDDLLLALAY